MSVYDLPRRLTIAGIDRPINYDWRTGIDCMTALQDAELTDIDKGAVVLELIYKDKIQPDEVGEALKQAMWFLSGGRDDSNDKPAPKLLSWEQDARYIVSAVNRVAGREIRSESGAHWWTFLGWYQEIGDCTLAQIVRVRNLKARGKKMAKEDIFWYRENRDIVDFKVKFTELENETLKAWGV